MDASNALGHGIYLQAQKTVNPYMLAFDGRQSSNGLWSRSSLRKISLHMEVNDATEK